MAWNKRQAIFNNLFGKTKEFKLIEKNMKAGKVTVFTTEEDKKRAKEAKAAKKSAGKRGRKGAKGAKGKKGAAGDRERSRDTKKKSGKKEESDGPRKLKIKATKFIEHKTEWKIELLFKTPDLRSHKFWKIKCVFTGGQCKTVVNFGRYGKKCRVSEKAHPSRAAAEKFEAKKIREKTNKGYFKVMMIGSGLGKNSVHANEETEITGFKSAPKCVICLEGKIDHVFTPCGHMCICEACVEDHMKGDQSNWYGRQPAKCPICNCEVTAALFVG